MSNSEFFDKTVAEIAKQLGRPVKDAEQTQTACAIEAEDYEDAFSPYEAALEIAPILRAAAAKRVRVPNREPKVFYNNWSTPLALLYANIAEEQPDVVAFRTEILSDKLINVDDVETWIKERLELQPRGTIKVESVAYAVPGDEWAHNRGVVPNSTLDRLRIISCRIADATNWPAAAATVWILCGAIPESPSVVVGTKQTFGTPFGNRQRIVLDIDADVSPAEVMEIYRRERSKCFEHTDGTKTRRPLQTRTLRVAASVFATPWKGWKAHQRQWNTANPSDEINNIRTFRRIVNRAQRHLLNYEVSMTSKDK
jgi:hypothetical protein